MRFSIIFFAAVAALLCALTSPASAARPKPTPTPTIRNTACPPIIGIRDGAVYHKVNGADKRGIFLCFRKEADATKAGMRSKPRAIARNMTGWYRLRLDRTLKNTCGSSTAGAGVLFFQVKQDSAGVYGEFCPSLGRLNGIKTDEGMTLSNTEDITASSVLCPDSQVRRIQYLELKPIINGSSGFTANYKIVEQCMGTDYQTRSCIKEFSGTGFIETHPIWPAVPANPQELPVGCNLALTKCVDCHSNLAGLGGN